MAKKIVLRQGRWGSETPVTFILPDSVTVNEVAPTYALSMSSQQIEEHVHRALGKAHGAGTLTRGNSVALVIDDLWRPTPVAPILASVLGYLRARGFNESEMTIVIACGTHGRPDESQLAAKIGPATKGIRVVVADCHAGNVFLCRTAGGTPLSVNKQVVEARNRILIGGVYPHPNAGFSGGEKLLVPGVCGFETIEYLHEMMPGARHRAGSTNTPFRGEIAKCSERIGPSLLINACLTADGEIAALFCGNPVEAFGQAEHYAREHYRVELLPHDTDIVIIEAFPFDMSFNLIYDRALWPIKFHRKARQIVVVGECPQGVGNHELDYSLPIRLRRRLRQFVRGNFKGISQLGMTLARRVAKYDRLPAFTLVSGSLKGKSEGIPNSVYVVQNGQNLSNEWQNIIGHTSCTIGIYRAAGLTYYGG